MNPFFDWAKMRPASCSEAAQVLFCCCCPQGQVVLNTFVDKAAYQSGEMIKVGGALIRSDCTLPLSGARDSIVYRTLASAFSRRAAQVSANIKNDSKSNINKMNSKLVRCIVLSDGYGNRRTFNDKCAVASYEGVLAKTEATREMPLPLVNRDGPLLP